MERHVCTCPCQRSKCTRPIFGAPCTPPIIEFLSTEYFHMRLMFLLLLYVFRRYTWAGYHASMRNIICRFFSMPRILILSYQVGALLSSRCWRYGRNYRIQLLYNSSFVCVRLAISLRHTLQIFFIRPAATLLIGLTRLNPRRLNGPVHVGPTPKP